MIIEQLNNNNNNENHDNKGCPTTDNQAAISVTPSQTINGTSSKTTSIANKFISTTSLSSLLKLNKNNNNTTTNNNNNTSKKMSNLNNNSNNNTNTSASSNTNNMTNNKLNIQQQITNGLFIRKEIQRFESVHPNIYSVYDLIDAISDFNLQQQIRDHIVNIEDSFVNSQEWTLSRSVPDLKLGILGLANSGKSSLVHRFLTGTYMQEESPEGGRFKKEVIIDGQSYLLLIRDEGGQPEMQFTHWVDAVIFVFSLENEDSFLTVHQYYLKMSQYRNMSDVPFILVGTQDYITETNPRCIDDARARSLANELKKCSYYETCATYGLHVERVFHDACQKVVNLRTQLLCAMANITNASSNTNNRPTTPQSNIQNQQSSIRLLAGSHQQASNGISSISASTISSISSTNGLPNNNNNNNTSPSSHTQLQQQQQAFYLANPHLLNAAALHCTITNQPNNLNGNHSNSNQNNNNVFKEPFSMQQQAQQLLNDNKKSVVNINNQLNNNNKFLSVDSQNINGNNLFVHSENGQQLANPLLITPCSTPNQKRKDNNRRRSNLFTPNKKEDKQNKQQLNDMGIGRSIPVKQGFLYKKTNSTINKDWKKKFVTLNDDGSLRYYPSMNDYMDDSHGKEIDLQKTTIKIPGANKPRIGKSLIHLDANKLNNDINSLNLNNNLNILTNLNDPNVNNKMSEEQPGLVQNGESQTNYLARIDVNSKKRHRRIKSNHKSDQNNPDEQEGFEFIIVSLDNKQWNFEAASNEEREEWVQAIEAQILSSLQSNEPNKLKSKNGGFTVDSVTIQTLKNVPGNSQCVDCDAPNPVWASLNHGALICIECSGIHRNLGTHLSRVRSLELDDWSNELIQVMTSIGNKMINSIYEANFQKYPKSKPNPNTSREEKEKWIRAKYESKQFLANLPNKEITVGKQLLEAVSRQDIPNVILCLAHSKPDDVNSCVSQLDKRTSLHIAASQSSLVILQLLIWYGADVEATDNQGRNALAYARNSNSNECCQLLIHNGCKDVISNTLTRKSNTSISTSHLTNGNTYDKITTYNII